MTIRCVKCNGTNPDDARFCQKCGEKLGSQENCCASCGAKNALGATFCKSCGAKLAAVSLTTEQWHDAFKTKYWFYRQLWDQNGQGWNFYQEAFRLYHRKTGTYLNLEKFALAIPITGRDWNVQCLSYLNKNAYHGMVLAMETKWVIADLSNERLIVIAHQNLKSYSYKDWCMALTINDESVLTMQVKQQGSGYANFLDATNLITSFSSKTSMTDVVVQGREAEKARDEVAQNNRLGNKFWLDICSYITEVWKKMGLL